MPWPLTPAERLVILERMALRKLAVIQDREFSLFAFLESMEHRIMTAVSDLTDAVTSLAANFAALDKAIQAEIDAMGLNTGNTLDVEAIKTAAGNIAAVSASMAADAKKLTDSLPPTAPTPSPAPPA